VDTTGFYVTVLSHNTPNLSIGLTADANNYTAQSVVKHLITVKNGSGATFSKVKIAFPFPPNTAAGGAVVPSVGSWTETCANGVKCYEWTIPSLSPNQTATLTVPLKMLTGNEHITTTAQLISSTPVDQDPSNNTATWQLAPAFARLSADNQAVTLDIKSLSPNPTNGALLVTLKSIVDKDVTFDFYNAVGSKVYSQTQQVQHGENELFFDVTKLANGIYFIRTSEQDEKLPLTKFVKH
jgi:hypothetical protein